MPTKRGAIRFFTFFKRLPAESRLDFLPALKVLRDYDTGKLKRDFLAGINVALLAFPQGMAYAMIAGLPIEYGLYGSAIALIVGMLFAGSHFVVLGPTNATSVLLLSTFSTVGMVTLVEKASIVPTLLLLVGLFLILGAMLRTASLIQYVSRTVVTGYIMAAASLIIVNQVQSLLGFQFGEGERAVSFFDVMRLTLEHLYKLPWESGVTWYPLGLGVVTLLIYLLLQRRLRFLPNVALTLVLASFAHAFFTGFLGFENRVEMLASPAAGSLQITWPQFSLEQFRMLFGTALALALLCVLEGLSIGKSLAARKGLRLDANQEMFSMGMANLGCSLLSGMAASGSLTRSALNASSGAVTQVSSLISGVLCLVGVFTLGQFIGLVPKPCLAVMVMVIGVSLFNLKQYRMVTRATFSDSVVFWITLVTGLFFALDFAIYVGVGASILLYLRKAADPHLVEYGFTEEGELQELEKRQRSDLEISIVHVEGELFFGAADLFLEQIRRFCADPNLKVVILKMRNARHLDATSCMALEELIQFMRQSEQHILVCEVKKDTLRVFKKSGLYELIGRDNLFPDLRSNPTYSTARAVRRAKEIVGGKKTKVSIYIDSLKQKKASDS